MRGDPDRDPTAFVDFVGLRGTSLLVRHLSVPFVMSLRNGKRTDFEVRSVIAARHVNMPPEALSEERIRLKIAYYEDRIADAAHWKNSPSLRCSNDIPTPKRKFRDSRGWEQRALGLT